MNRYRHIDVAQTRTSDPRRAHAARPRRVAAGLVLVGTFLAGCGGGSTASLGSGPVATPASTADAPAAEAEIQAAPTEPTSQPAFEPPDASETEVELVPESDVEPDVEPESDVEPKSDAALWVDRRQNAVVHEVYENNMDAVKAWTP